MGGLVDARGTQNIPKQNNGVDCGVFVCQYAKNLARDLPLDFAQKDMGELRRAMILELAEKRLIEA